VDARFAYACSTPAQLPPETLPELAVAGRSNCGKSSLINAVTGRSTLARTSAIPGRTRQLVFFRVAAAGPQVTPFYLVDLPGYGYARAPRQEQQRWAELVNHYIATRDVLVGLLLLIDARRLPETEELDLLRWARESGLAWQVVLTKADQLSKSARFGAAERAKRTLGLARRPSTVSVHDRIAIADLRHRLLSLVAGQ